MMKIDVAKRPAIRFGLALLLSAAGAGLCHADCAALRGLAQQHANDMARRNSLDHAGFMQHRGPAGAVAENVAVGCDTEACARRMWMQSPQHRANMMLGGCQAVASAVSASGRRYWVMEIGGTGGGRGAAGARSVRGVRGARGPSRAGGAGSGGAAPDFSIEGSKAP